MSTAPGASRHSAAATARQVEKYRSSGGRKGNTTVGTRVFRLDVVGRSSGERRPVMLMHGPRGDDQGFTERRIPVAVLERRTTGS